MPEASNASLRAIKIAHTLIWAFFASCILAIPVVAHRGEYGFASLLIGVVGLEVLVLVVNRWQCPLTTIAGRHTVDRRDNFDIFLPEWLARHNKTIFGILYVGGSLYTFVIWWAAGA